MKAVECILFSLLPWLFVLLFALHRLVFNTHLSSQLIGQSVAFDESSFGDNSVKDKSHVILASWEKHSPDRLSIKPRKKVLDVLKDDEKSISPNSASRGSNIIRTRIDHSHDYRENNDQLPSISSIPQNIGKRRVFIDWSSDSDLLSYFNYKSLESFLACCYTTNIVIEVMIMGPPVADYYKVSRLLSKQTFLKYKKQGYQVVTVVHSKIESLFHATNERELRPYIYPGEVFFNYHYNATVSRQGAKTGIATQLAPLSFWFYGRLARLFTEGGEYYDLSWLHQRPLSNARKQIRNGVFILPFCYDKPSSMLLPRPNIRTLKQDSFGTTLYGSRDFVCTSSSILIFSTPKNLVLECVLHEYDDPESKFRLCIESPQFHVSDEKLKPFEEALCVKRAFERCFTQTNTKNDLLATTLISSTEDNERRYLGTNVSLLSSVEAKGLLSDSPMLWLGVEAVAGRWATPRQGSYLQTKISVNNMKIKHAMLTHFKSIDVQVSSQKHCRPYGTEEYYESRHRRQAGLACSLSFIIPGFMKAGTTYLYDILTKHPQVLTALKGVGFKETGCYYTEQVSLNRSHNRMNCFPFVEPFEDLIYGDATVYYILRYPVASYVKRENPNIKTFIIVRDPIERALSHHRFSYEQYSSRGLADMNVVVDTALTPGMSLDRIYQRAKATVDAYDAGLSGKEEMDELLSLTSRFFSPGLKAVINATYQRAANTLFFSLYFHAVHRWDEVMGAQNIYVIEAERISQSRSTRILDQRSKAMGLSSHSQLPPEPLSYSGGIMNLTLEEELDEVFRFVGVSPLKAMATPWEHRTQGVVPPYHQINEVSKSKLEVFFEPFNRLFRSYMKYRKLKLST